MDGLRFPDQRRDGLRPAAAGGQGQRHPVQGPEEVDGGGSAGSQLLGGAGHAGAELGGILTLELHGGQTNGIGRRDPDGGGAADHQTADGVGHLPIIGVVLPDLLHGKLGLIKQCKGISLPANGIHYNGLLFFIQ